MADTEPRLTPRLDKLNRIEELIAAKLSGDTSPEATELREGVAELKARTQARVDARNARLDRQAEAKAKVNPG